jgi:hypothetical protein
MRCKGNELLNNLQIIHEKKRRNLEVLRFLFYC